MLSFFRKGGAAQVIIGVVVFAIIIVFVLEFRTGGGQSTGSLKVECSVRVHDECVSLKDFQATFGLVVPRGTPAKRIRELKLRKKVLDGLVERELLLRDAKRLKVSISEKEVDDELLLGRAHVSVPVVEAPKLGFAGPMVRYLPVRNSKTKEFDYKIYERSVRNYAGRSPREFKEMQTEEMIAERMRDLVRSRVRVAEAIAYQTFERERTKATARVVQIRRPWFARYVADISDQAVNTWAAANTAQIDEAWKKESANFKAGCQLTREIFIAHPPGATPEDKTLNRDKIESAKKRLDDGEDFGLVARQMSEAPTHQSGGDMGCLGEHYGEGHAELSKATADLKPGAITDIVETKKGFHIVQVVAKLDEKDVEGIGKGLVAKTLTAAFEANRLAKEFAEKLLEAVKGGEALNTATDRLALEYATMLAKPKKDEQPRAMDDSSRPKVTVSAPFSRSGRSVDGALPTDNPTPKLFELKPDEVIPKAIGTMSGFAVVQLKELTLAKREDFEKDKENYINALRRQKQQEALELYVADLKEASKSKIEINDRLAADPSKAKDDG